MIVRLFFISVLLCSFLRTTLGLNKENDKKTLRQIDPVLALLPWTPQDIPGQRVSFILKAYGGCFIWTSQRSDLVSVEPIYEEFSDCSNKANIVPTATSFHGGRAWVFARDKDSGFELRCEVHVAPIANIAIDTPARSIGVDTVETVTIRATDEQGNVFSSLEGLWFQWQSTRLDVLSFSSLDSDVYYASPMRQAVQKLGGQADLVLLKGISSGRSRVTARLVSSAYHYVPKALIDLDVSEPLMIEPPFLRTIPLARFSYSLRILKPQTSALESPIIPLPSPYFKWSSSVSGREKVLPVIDIHPSKAITFVNCTNSCEAKILVTDQRILNNVADSVLIVSPLARLQFYYSDEASKLEVPMVWNTFQENRMNPTSYTDSIGFPTVLGSDSTWYLIKDKVYLIGLRGLSDDAKQLYLPSNLDIELFCYGKDISQRPLNVGSTINTPCVGLRVLRDSTTRQHILVKASQINEGMLIAELPPGQGLYPNRVFKEKIRIQQLFRITNAVTVALSNEEGQVTSDMWIHNLVVFPFDHQWSFRALGGSGTYSWSTSNASIATINHFDGNVGRIITKGKLGYTTIAVFDTHNPSNRRIFDVVVSSLRYFLLDPPFEKIQMAKSVEIPLRALPQSLPCDTLHCTTNVEEWNRKLNSVQISNGIPVSDHRITSNEHDLLGLHFLNCSNLEAVMEQNIHVKMKSTVPNTSVSWSLIHDTSSPFVCGFVAVTAPLEPGLVELTVSLGPTWTVTRQLEIFSPMSFLLGTEQALWNDEKPHSNLSVLDQKSLSIAVGSWVDFHIKGGPSDTRRYAVSTNITASSDFSQYARIKIVPDALSVVRVMCLDAARPKEIVLTVVRKSSPPEQDRFTDQFLDSLHPHHLKTYFKNIHPYRVSPIMAHVDLKFSCEYPSYIALHPLRPFPTQREYRSVSQLFPGTKEERAVPIEYAQCAMEHPLGVFVYAEDNSLINFWSTAYETSWSFNTKHIQYVNAFVRKLVIPADECNRIVDINTNFRLHLNSWKQNVVKEFGEASGLEDIGARVSKHIMYKPSKSYELLNLRSRLALIGVPPIEAVPSRAFTVHPFYYDLNCARRIQLRFGSGQYRVHVTNDNRMRINFSQATLQSDRIPSTQALILSQPHKISHASVESGLRNTTKVKGTDQTETALHQRFNGTQDYYYYAIHYQGVPDEAINQKPICLRLFNPEYDPLVSRDRDTDSIRLMRKALASRRGDQLRSPQSFWDVYVMPKENEPPFSFTFTLYDSLVLGQSEIRVDYSFSFLARLVLRFDSVIYRFQSDATSLPMSLDDSREIVNGERSSDLLHVDVNDVVGLSVEAFDATYNLPFDKEDKQLMGICLTVIGDGSHVRLSCLGEGASPNNEKSSEDRFWSDVLNQAKGTYEDAIMRLSTFHSNSHSITTSSPSTLWFQGLRKGIYTVQTVGHNAIGSPVVSNVLRVIVSDPLVLIPSHLVLLPGYHTFEIKTKGQRHGETVEHSLDSTVVENEPVTRVGNGEVVSLTWVTDNDLGAASVSQVQSSLLRVTTGNSCGRVNIIITEKDHSQVSSIKRQAKAEIIVALPHSLRIYLGDALSDMLPSTRVKLRSFNSHTLKAVFFTKDKVPFTLAHHWLTKAATHENSPDSRVTFSDSNQCQCQWTSTRSDLLRFSVNERDSTWNFTGHTGVVGLPEISGQALFVVNVMASFCETTQEATVHVKCGCGSLEKGRKRLLPEVLAHQYEAQLGIQVVPDGLAFHHALFLEPILNRIMLDQSGLNRYQYRVQSLRLASFGEYVVHVPKGFDELNITVTPHAQYPLLTATLVPESNTIVLKVHVESSEQHKVTLFLRSHQHPTHEDITLSIDIRRPASLSVTPLISNIHVGSTTRFFPLVKDELGYPLLIPSNYEIVTQTSHASVVHDRLVIGEGFSSFDSPYVEIVGLRQGCAAVSIGVTTSGTMSRKTEIKSCSARVCVDASMYPSSSWVLSGGEVHTIVTHAGTRDAHMKEKIQLKLSLKSSIVGWVWLTHGSPQCVNKLQTLLEVEKNFNLHFHQSVVKWITKGQMLLTERFCGRISKDMMNSLIRHRLDAVVSKAVQTHLYGAVQESQLFTLPEAAKKGEDHRKVLSAIHDAVYTYTLGITVPVPVSQSNRLRWVVVMVSKIVKDAITAASLSEDAYDELSYHVADGGITYDNYPDPDPQTIWSVAPFNVSSYPARLSVNSAHIQTMGVAGSYLVKFERPDAVGQLQLHVANQVSKGCVYLRYDTTDDPSTDIIAPPQDAGKAFHSQLCSTVHQSVIQSPDPLVIQNTPIDVVIIPYGSTDHSGEQPLLTTPFVTQRITVTCDIHDHPLFHVLPIYRVILLTPDSFLRTTIGCRLLPRLPMRDVLPSRLKLSLKLQGLTSIPSHFEYEWPLKWTIVLQQHPPTFISVKNLPHQVHRDLNLQSTREGWNAIHSAICVDARHAEPITFKAIVGSKCALTVNTDKRKQWMITTERVRANITDITLTSTSWDVRARKASLMAQPLKPRDLPQDPKSYLDITWITLRCGTYETRVPVFNVAKSKSSWTFPMSAAFPLHYFTQISTYLLKLVYTLAFIAIATCVYYMSRNQSNLPRRTRIGLSVMTQRPQGNTGTPYRQWNQNRDIGIGGYAAHSPSSSFYGSVRRSADIRT